MDIPNIIFIMADQHRGDCLGCMGNSEIITPHLDALAQDGITFKMAYSSTPSCTPARSALLTGMAPWKHGMLGYGKMGVQYKYEMPRMLRKAGYYTMGIGKMHFHPQRNLHGFHRTILDESGRRESKDFISDYHRWFAKKAPGLDPNATGIGWNSNDYGDYALDEKLHPTHWTGQQALEIIENYKMSKPLFLKVSFARPHSPYDAPSRFVDMYQWEDMPDPFLGDWIAPFKKIYIKNAPAFGDFGIEHAKRARRHYYANITFIDKQIGKIIAKLKEKGMYKNSLIIFTSDHGDMLGDHHHWRKTYPFEGSSQIPLILRWPSQVQAQIARGTALDNLAELRDILPTMLDACNQKIPDEMDGLSLLSLIKDKNPNWRSILDLEHSTAYHRKNAWIALTDGTFKYIYYRMTGKEMLFNLKTDPKEETDLSQSGAHGKTLLRFRGKMVVHLEPRGKKWVKKGKLKKLRRHVLYSPNFPQ